MSKALAVVGFAGQPIRSFEEWRLCALPSHRRTHWKEGRSACELGRSWTRSGLPAAPAEVAALMNRHEDLHGLCLLHGAVEHETPLPYGPAGPRSHDLMLAGELDVRRVVVCIEAKADETFGGTIAAELTTALKRSATTRFPLRLDWLCRVLLRKTAFLDGALRPEIAAMHYQLLAAVAGTLIEAQRQGAKLAVLLIQEFKTSATIDRKMNDNATAWNLFLTAFVEAQGYIKPLSADTIAGPILVMDELGVSPAFTLSPALYLGKLVTDVPRVELPAAL